MTTNCWSATSPGLLYNLNNFFIDISTRRSFYKHILAKAVKHQDMESEDYEFYKNLSYLIDTKVEDMGYDMYFSTEIQVKFRNSAKG